MVSLNGRVVWAWLAELFEVGACVVRCSYRNWATGLQQPVPSMTETVSGQNSSKVLACVDPDDELFTGAGSRRRR